MTSVFTKALHEEKTMDHAISKQERIVTIGGTFDTLHPGHKEYIRLAFEYADRVLIYVSSDEYCRDVKRYDGLSFIDEVKTEAQSFNDRIKKLEEFLRELKCQDRYQICPLDKLDDLIFDYLKNPELREKIYMAIISPEYYNLFNGINNDRIKAGIKDFLILVKQRSYYYENDKVKDYSSSKTRKHTQKKRNRATKILDFILRDGEI